MYKVLLVDDEPMILEGLTAIIPWEEYGLEIEATALDGMAAIEILKSRQIHLIITDIKMPKMDGLKLLKYIREQDMNIKCIILSGFNDFEFVREAAKLGIENYLLKPVDEKELIPTLVNAVEKIQNEIYKKIEIHEGISILRDNILFRWVSGDIGDEELLERASLLGFDLKAGEYLVAVAKVIDNSRQQNYLMGKNRRQAGFAVNNIFLMLLKENELGTSFLDLNGNILVLMKGNTISQKTAEIHHILAQCIENVNALLKLDIFVTLGTVEKDFRNVFKSYIQACKIQDYSLILGSNRIITFDKIEFSSAKRRNTFKYNLKALNDAVRQMSEECVDDAVDELFAGLISNKDLTPTHIQQITIEALLSIVNTLNSMNLEGYLLYDNLKDLLSNVYEFTTIHELSEWLKDTIHKCFILLNQKDESISPIVKKAIEYIRLHYFEDINLKSVAAKFNMNAFYLGQLFSKETHISFNSYLNAVRIEKAKELLAAGRLKTNEVALKVGYFNTSYFSTIFKKVTGVTPSEYVQE